MKVLTSATLGECEGVAHGFFTRHGGVSEGIYGSLNCGLGSQDGPHRVRKNLARVAGHLRVRAHDLITLKQTHSTDVRVIEGPVPTQRPQADALVTAKAGIALGITGADCPTVLFVDSGARVIGAAHAGWRGAFQGVLEATLRAMLELGARRENIVAGIGPGIQQASYEVGEEFRAAFVQQDATAAQYFKTTAGSLLFDLPGYIHRRLQLAELRHIDQHTHDTFADEDLFSYRRSRRNGEADYGRQLGVIVLR